MTLAGVERDGGPVVRSASVVRAAGRRAAERFAEAERLRAAAVVDLVDYHDGFGPSIDGFLTPQRHLISEAGLGGREANRMHRLVRFCARHPLAADGLACGALTVDHADALAQVAEHVDEAEFADALADLIGAADCVELSVFVDRIRVWSWRVQPEATEDDVAEAYDRRSLTSQRGLFGGSRGKYELDAAGTAVVEAALFTTPDSADRLEDPRTLAQRKADRLVELAGLVGLVDDDTAGPEAAAQAQGARQVARSSVDVVVDLPTLLGAGFDLDDHRTVDRSVDWDSIQAGFALTGSAPRPAMAQFLCDASWRTLVTSGGSVVLDYTHAKPELNPAQRRAVQRRDRHCQFHGCDRHWSWCDVHHLVEKHRGGRDAMDNLVLLCRRHHTLVHQGGWQLERLADGRIATTSP